jgi:hypothetical protein
MLVAGYFALMQVRFYMRIPCLFLVSVVYTHGSWLLCAAVEISRKICLHC